MTKAQLSSPGISTPSDKIEEKWVAYHLEDAQDDEGITHRIRAYLARDGSVTHDLSRARLFKSFKSLNMHCKKHQAVPKGQHRKLHRVFHHPDGSLTLPV